MLMLLVSTYLHRVKDDLNNESFVTRTVNVVVNQKTGNHSCGEHKRKQCCNILWAAVVVVNATATDDCS
jgi:hypothetical protein